VQSHGLKRRFAAFCLIGMLDGQSDARRCTAEDSRKGDNPVASLLSFYQKLGLQADVKAGSSLATTVS
jgi:hypothetical protein